MVGNISRERGGKVERGCSLSFVDVKNKWDGSPLANIADLQASRDE